MSLDKIADRIVKTDVLVVGSEGTGARACLALAERGLDVVVITKGYVGRSGATLTADADIDVDSYHCKRFFALPGDERDSIEHFFEDMCEESDYLGDQEMVWLHCEEAPIRVKEFVDWGGRIDMLTHAPGHKYARGIWLPGTEFARVLAKKINEASDRVRLIEHCMLVDLVKDGDRVVGGVALDYSRGEVVVIQAKATILCTGGAMRIYPHTTAPEELTGDGFGAAYRAGASLVDMEFPMFLPYVLIAPIGASGVDFTYLLSAYLHTHALNREGERFMAKWDPQRMERTTRDVNSIASYLEIQKGLGGPNGGVFLSLKHLPNNLTEYSSTWFPDDFDHWRYGGFDMKKFMPDPHNEAAETVPASHFWNGGVRINKDCETGVPGLFAAGEGSGPIMGANRISGNALTMTQVWGHRAGVAVAAYVNGLSHGNLDDNQVAAIRAKIFAPLERQSGENAVELRKHLQKVAWAKFGVIREEKGLNEGLSELAKLEAALPQLATRTKTRKYNKEWVEAVQLENMVLTSRMICQSSLTRTESRGALFRMDCQKKDNVNWLKNVNIRRKGSEMEIFTSPVNLKYIRPKAEMRDYGLKNVETERVAPCPEPAVYEV